MGVFQKLMSKASHVMVTHELDIARYPKRKFDPCEEGRVVADVAVEQPAECERTERNTCGRATQAGETNAI